jgi:hypothetical protein
MVAGIAAFVGFAAGIQLGASGTAPSPASPGRAASSVPVPAADLSTSVPTLDPVAIVAAAPRGSSCALIETVGGEQPLPFHRSWLFRCAVAVGDRPALVGAIATGIKAALARDVVVPDGEESDWSSPVVVDWWRYLGANVVGWAEFTGLPAATNFDLLIVHAASPRSEALEPSG